MHRFIENKTIGTASSCDLKIEGEGVQPAHARLALRSDGSLWLLAEDNCELHLNRGSGWTTATRIRLCEGDQVRIGSADFDLSAAAAIFSAAPMNVEQKPPTNVPGANAPRPLVAPSEVLERPRRNPGTGQVEHQNERPQENTQ